MTFDNAPSAIDGALLTSAIVRRGNFAFGSGQNGVVLPTDLKVTELAVPGVGILIDAGVGIVVNGYQDIPNEAYVVSNPSTHTVPSGEMPGSNPSAKSYIVAIVVGDPDFSQTGHPWMGATDPPIGEEQSFQYVRPTLIEVSAGATTLTVDYPALVLARIDVPASTTTIIDSYITDLRVLSRARQSQEIFVSPGGTWTGGNEREIASGSDYFDWGSADFAPSVRVPSWATRAIVVTNINGVILRDSSVNVKGGVRTQLGSVSGPATAFDLPVRTGAIRENLMAAGEYDVSSVAGTDQVLRVEGFENIPATPTNDQTLRLTAGSQQIFDVRFFEE